MKWLEEDRIWQNNWKVFEGGRPLSAPGPRTGWEKRTWGRLAPFLLLSNYVVLGKSFNFSKPIFLAVKWEYIPINLKVYKNQMKEVDLERKIM